VSHDKALAGDAMCFHMQA